LLTLRVPGEGIRAQIPPSDRYAGTGLRLARVPSGAASPEAKTPPLAVVPFDADAAKKHQEVWAADWGVPVAFTNTVKMSMRLIPPGEFMMGSTPAEIKAELNAHDGVSVVVLKELEFETPQHRVRITKPFGMSSAEVTVTQFREFVEATKYKTTCETDGKGGWGWRGDELIRAPEFNWKNVGAEQQATAPVWNVSWEDAIAFCAWLSEREKVKYRLPTEAEWEYACRAGTATRCYWGQDLRGHYAWNRPTNFGLPHQVERKIKNAFGLHDMCGNVSEWCQDKYLDNYYSVFEKTPVVDDPQGPTIGNAHVIRGGGVNGRPWSSSSTFRGQRQFVTTYVGFRVVCEIPRAAQ